MQVPTQVVMQVDVYSDVVCPWCWVGKARFERAVAEVAADGIDVEVTYRPFELDPGVPPGGEPLAPYLARKFGGDGALAAIQARLGEAADGLDVEFRWEGMHRRNTFDAHRLLAWALEVGGTAAQGPLKDRLLRAYFTEHLDVADHAVLADLAADAGLDHDLAADALATGWGAEAVRAQEAAAHEQGITAVPSAVVEGRWMLQGAHDVASWAKALRHMAAELAVDTTADTTA